VCGDNGFPGIERCIPWTYKSNNNKFVTYSSAKRKLPLCVVPTVHKLKHNNLKLIQRVVSLLGFQRVPVERGNEFVRLLVLHISHLYELRIKLRRDELNSTVDVASSCR
jgi:hypothetical protein